MEIHSGEKPFKCSKRSYAGNSGSDLTIHIRIHSGENPVKWSECSFATRLAGTLTRHMRIHLSNVQSVHLLQDIKLVVLDIYENSLR